MALFGRRKPAAAPTNAIALDETSELFRVFAGMYSNASGVSVTHDSAVASVAVLACLLVRSESLMLCPVDVIEKVGRDRVPAPNHPVHVLISDEPNPVLTAEEMWKWKQLTEDIKGNAFVRTEWFRGNPVACWPMIGPEPAAHWGNGRLVWDYLGDEFTKAGPLQAHEVMHFKGPLLSRSPYKARSLVEATAENIGLSIATQQFLARFLGNGNHFPLYLQTDNALKAEDLTALKQQLDDGAGLFGAGTVRIFDRGLNVKHNEMSLRDADLTGQQRWILEQVARTWRVPLPMIGDLTHGTYTNTEQADLWLSKYTASPILRNTEGVIRRGLFLPSERDRFVAKFNLNAMMRGDFKTRTAGYSILIQCGVLSPNEARAFEDWNPYDGGDEYLRPLNTAPVGADPNAGDGSPTLGWLPPRTQVDQAASLAPLLGDARERIEARHRQNVERGRGRSETEAFAAVVLGPIAETAAALGIPLEVDQLVDTTLADLGV